MTGGIRNPAKLPSPLLPAEEKFARCLAEGKSCAVGNGELPEKEVRSGKGANVVRGEVIRFFAYGGNEENLVSGPIIHLQGAWVSEDLILTHASIPYALLFNNCYFGAPVIMAHAECAALYLNGSHLIKELNADGLTTKGHVNLRDDFSAKGMVRLMNANIGGNLDCDGGKFNNQGGMAFLAERLTTKGDANFRNGFSAEGEVQLMNANIGGNLDCDGGKFNNQGGHALHADGLTAKGDVNFRKGFSAEGEVRLLGVSIGGNLDCMDGKFHNPGGKALSADGLTTKGSVYLAGDFSAEGEVRLLGVSIGGNLDCLDGKFNNQKGYALVADGLAVKGDVGLNGDFSAEGEVRLFNVSIGGNLFCADGKFHDPKGYALVADRLTTTGNVYFRGDFSAKGEVRLSGANIGGDLSCADGKFHNPGGYALVADRLTAQGTVYMNRGFSAAGGVRLFNANIGRNLDCTGGTFHNPGGMALDVDGGNISGGLLWRNITCEDDVNLAYVNVDVLADDSSSWKSCKVNLSGFTYSQFSDSADVQFRIDWLSRRPAGIPFSPQPYEQAAKILFGMGRPIDAWDILCEKRRLERRHNKDSWLQQAWGGMIDAMTDFVYRPLRTVKWTTGIVLAGAVFFGAADYCERIVPHQPIVLAKAGYQNAIRMGSHPFDAAREAVPDYPGFNPLVFSLDVFIPLFNLHQESYWAPDSGADDFFRWLARRRGEFEGWWLLTAWYWIEIMAGWLLSSLLLLSVTGLLRPRIGGGD